jgi:predicted transcriptional regulator
MATLTIRLSDEKHERLRHLVEQRKISMNKLIDELSVALAEFDAETGSGRVRLAALVRKA